MEHLLEYRLRISIESRTRLNEPILHHRRCGRKGSSHFCLTRIEQLLADLHFFILPELLVFFFNFPFARSQWIQSGWFGQICRGEICICNSRPKRCEIRNSIETVTDVTMVGIQLEQIEDDVVPFSGRDHRFGANFRDLVPCVQVLWIKLNGYAIMIERFFWKLLFLTQVT